MIAWYHRQFVEVGDTMFKDEFPNLDYSSPEAADTNSLCNLLRERMVDYFTGIVHVNGSCFHHCRYLIKMPLMHFI